MFFIFLLLFIKLWSLSWVKIIRYVPYLLNIVLYFYVSVCGPGGAKTFSHLHGQWSFAFYSIVMESQCFRLSRFSCRFKDMNIFCCIWNQSVLRSVQAGRDFSRLVTCPLHCQLLHLSFSLNSSRQDSPAAPDKHLTVWHEDEALWASYVFLSTRVKSSYDR